MIEWVKDKAAVAELEDAVGSKPTGELIPVRVRIPPAAL